jgi:Holliday junction resolvasome RuvABC endonuclease subunit
MILDLRQDHMRVTERASMLESLNTELNEKNSALESRVLQLERQVSILLGDHEQHMLSILNGFKSTNEQVCSPVLLLRANTLCALTKAATLVRRYTAQSLLGARGGAAFSMAS